MFNATAVEKTREELQRLQTTRVSLEDREQKARAELARLRAGLGEAELSAILDGADPSTTRRKLSELEIELEAMSGAQAALIGRIESVLKRLNAEKAGELREQAAKLRKALDKHNEEAGRLLAKLQEHQECLFIPLAESESAIAGIIGGTAGRVVVASPGLPIPWPKSIRLKQEIEALLAQATAIEKRPVNRGGAISSPDLDGLLAIARNPEAIGPTEAEIRAWFAETSASAAAAWERSCREDYAYGQAPTEHTVMFTLAWTAGGRIDRRQSGAVNDVVHRAVAA